MRRDKLSIQSLVIGDTLEEHHVDRTDGGYFGGRYLFLRVVAAEARASRHVQVATQEPA
jgi:hypothetical protein